MKRFLGTAVLFALTLLTIMAIKQVDPPTNHAIPAYEAAQAASN